MLKSNIRKAKFQKKFQVAAFGAAMADIALLLLVFFMATTSTEPPKGVEVTLPKAMTEGAEQESIYISISKQGHYYYDGQVVSLNELKDQLSFRMGERNKLVSITADKNLNYLAVQRLLDLLQNSDFLNVVFMSEPKEKKF